MLNIFFYYHHRNYSSVLTVLVFLVKGGFSVITTCSHSYSTGVYVCLSQGKAKSLPLLAWEFAVVEDVDKEQNKAASYPVSLCIVCIV